MHKKESMALVYSASGMRPFVEEDLSRITGFLFFGQGFGDILCMTPMVEEAIDILGKDLDVWTRRTEVFQYHPRVRCFYPDLPALQNYLSQGNLLFVSPVGTTQDRFESHLIEQSSLGIVDLPPDKKRIRLYSCQEAQDRISKLLSAYPKDRRRVVIHSSLNIPLRTWPRESWTTVAQELAQDCLVFSVGKEIQYDMSGMSVASKSAMPLPIEGPHFVDLINQLSLHELYELIRVSDLVITFDGGVLHVANATETPIVAMFSDADPKNLMRFDSSGNLGHKTSVVVAPCPLQFCASRVGFNEDRCRMEGKDHLRCFPSPKQVLEEARKVLGQIQVVSH